MTKSVFLTNNFQNSGLNFDNYLSKFASGWSITLESSRYTGIITIDLLTGSTFWMFDSMMFLLYIKKMNIYIAKLEKVDMEMQ